MRRLHRKRANVRYSRQRRVSGRLADWEGTVIVERLNFGGMTADAEAETVL